MLASVSMFGRPEVPSYPPIHHRDLRVTYCHLDGGTTMGHIEGKLMSYVANFSPYFFIGYQRNHAEVGQSFFAPCKDCMELSEADRRLLLQPRVKQPETWGKMRLW